MTKKNTFKRVMALMLVLVCVMSSVSVVGVSAATQTTRRLRVYPNNSHPAYQTANYTFAKGKLKVSCVDFKTVKGNSSSNLVLCQLFNSKGELQAYSTMRLIEGYTTTTTFTIDKKGSYYFLFSSLSGWEEVLYMKW